MSEPKIIDIVTPPPYFQSYGLFNSYLLHDGSSTPLVYSSGGDIDGQFVYGEFGDNITPVDFTGILLLNHNKAPSSLFSVNRHGLSIVGKTTHETVDPISGQQNTLIKFPKMNSHRLAIGFTHTEPADEQKSLGELILFNENTITLQRDFSSYEERWREVAKEISLRNGGIHRVVTPSSDGQTLRYECVAQFNFMSEAEIESWRSLKEIGATFLFMPESETNPQNIYKCHFTGPFNVKSTTSYKGAGYTISVTLKEVK